MDYQVGVNERNIASQRPSGEAPFNPSTVRFQALGRRPTAPANQCRSTSAAHNHAIGNRSERNEVRGYRQFKRFQRRREVRFGPGETRQRKPAHDGRRRVRRLSANLTGVSTIGYQQRRDPVLCKSQTPSCSLPAAANQRPSGEKAALKRREPRSSANSRCPPARSNAYSWTLVTVSNP
jgi:hypothetical protein